MSESAAKPISARHPFRIVRSVVAAAVVTVSSVEILTATSFVVPPDHQLIRNATAIVIASPLASHTQLRHKKIIETVTTMSIEEVLKGSFDGTTLDVHEPGGVYENRVSTIPGVPRFKDGERYVLFLIRTDEGIWRVLDLILGKFRFDTDVLGHEVVLRDAQEIAGWDPDGKPHREQNRAAQPFLDFIRTTSRGGPAHENYLIPAEPLIGVPPDPFLNRRLVVVPLATFTPTSYTYIYSGSTGARWNIFPSAVTFFTRDANSNAVTATNNAMAAWNGDASSNVNLVNGGADPGTHTGGVTTPDGQNTIAFEKNLVAEFGAQAFTCNANSYSGTLGVGAVTNDSGTHIGPNGETFFTAAEGDVEMNQGLSNCTFFIGLGDFNSAVAHEIGHAMGFRHSDQDRDDASACPGTIECSTTAIMKAYIPTGLNGALQAWDRNAVDAVYPNPTVAAPTGVTATAQTSTSVSVNWNTVTGATSYHVYRSADRVTYTQVGTPASPPFTDSTASANTAYLYKVRAFDGSTESGDSNLDLATTTIFTDSSLSVGVTPVKAVHFTELRTAIDAVRKLANNGVANPYSYTDATLNSSVTVKAVHITDLRTALASARSALGLSAISYTDSTITAGSTLIKAVHITELRGGVQ